MMKRPHLKPPEGAEDLLRYHLHRLLHHYEPPRDVNVVHASEVTKESPEFCPRERVLLLRTGRDRDPDTVTASMEGVYALGRTIQDLVTSWFVKLGMAVGNWRCGECGHLHIFCKVPARCESCDAVGIHYEEMRFRSSVSGASCGIDLLVDLPGRSKLTVVELKSQQKEDFKGLAAVLAEHRTRTAWYLRLIAESDSYVKRYVDTQEARVLYVVKNGWGAKDPVISTWKLGDGPWTPFKEFRVQRQDGLTEPYHRKALAVEVAMLDGSSPEGICENQFCGRARGCPVAVECFA